MKNLKLILLTFVLIFSISDSKAQYGYGSGFAGPRTMITLSSGDIASLKGLTNINIVYDYSKMGVGAFKDEVDYLKKKEDDMKKDPAKFEKFKKSWFDSRKGRYEPKFETMFNKTIAKLGMVGKNDGTDAAVTLKVATVFTEPGYNIGISKVPAFVDMECTFMDKDGKELVRYFIKNSIGASAMGMDFDAGSRISESYAKASKMLAKDVMKRMKKVK
ncbi:hypothetical protein [Aurantibacillus circumpalustris]|uniref:hypothetical protein n=1 Tax=Aurantibacillus circumpalustris TaxID=3036359 RepID=UPI00295BD336|nr:hypothetical protein [Aurantibacillus circumpalustris]